MTTIERAFELARGGQCRSLEDVRRRLKVERYDLVDGHLASISLKRQLSQAIRLAG